MSDIYGRFDRYGLPSSYDQWRLSPPPEYEYDDDEEEDEDTLGSDPELPLQMYSRAVVTDSLIDEGHYVCDEECFNCFTRYLDKRKIPYDTGPIIVGPEGSVECAWCGNYIAWERTE